MMRLLLPIMLVGLFGSGCGALDECKDDTTGKERESCKSDSDLKGEEAEDFVLRGSVQAAFPITVNEESFNDTEDFFTQESARLPEKVKAAGYGGYSTRFDAQIGFQDLYVGMSVFISATEKRGYQGRTVITRNGTFAISLPADAAGDTYKIRAIKRANVLLTKGNEVRKFCYNFSAVDMDVPYGDKDKPIILESFKTTLTTYECVADPGTESLEIPANADNPTVIAQNDTTKAPEIKSDYRSKITPGVETRTIYLIAGPSERGQDIPLASRPDFSAGRWDWYGYESGLCESDSNAFPSEGEGLDCAVLSGPAGVYFVENIRAEYLATDAVWPTKDEALSKLQTDADASSGVSP